MSLKKTIFLLFICLLASGFAQDGEAYKGKCTAPVIYFSAGTHFGFWAIFGQKELPYNVKADILFRSKTAFGIGYTHDFYKNTFFAPGRYGANARRENLNLRFYQYLRDPDKLVSNYVGCSFGQSRWIVYGLGEDQTIKSYRDFISAQLLFGLKVNLGKNFCWLSEIGIGPPYALQTSLAYKF